MLVTLSLENRWEFMTALGIAWEWTQRRKRFYCDTGGNQTIEEYLATAREPNRKHFAIIDGQMVSLITIRMIADGDYEFHVTSPPHANGMLIANALLNLREGLFDTLGAEVARTSCPIYGNHEHKGSRHLAEACGMTATGVEWVSVFDENVLWREYELTRDKYYGQSKTSHH
jgi:hypothetical protein